MNFLPEKIDSYAIEHSQREPELLQQLYRETWQKVLIPQMISGPFQGRVLSMLSKIVSPKNILEIGTYTGYSGLCLAEGMTKEGSLHTIDYNEELHDIQQKYFNQSKWKTQIHSYIGNALEVIPQIDVMFDLVFIDADKKNYLNYLNCILPKLNQGAIILSDNVLWYGKVAEIANEKDTDTLALQTYNRYINEHPLLESILLPIRDGLTVSRVK